MVDFLLITSSSSNRDFVSSLAIDIGGYLTLDT